LNQLKIKGISKNMGGYDINGTEENQGYFGITCYKTKRIIKN